MRTIQRRGVHLALGANLGNRAANLAGALQRLSALGEVTACSSVYLTAPLGPAGQPAYFNAACELQSSLALEDLLDALQAIEWEMGRRPGVRWGPRPLDLDILLAGAELVEKQRLSVPHPRLAERAFVLVPLAEIAGGELHPVIRLTVRELLNRRPAEETAAVQRLELRGWPDRYDSSFSAEATSSSTS